jgi:carboxyl-terminal processing protease
MNRSRILFFLLSLAVLLPVISGTLSRAATDQPADDDALSKHLSVFSEVMSLIRRAYVEETSVDELLAGALDGATDALNPLSTFVPADAIDAYERVRGIGPSHSGLTVGKERGIAFVIAVDEGSPGAEAGLREGDILAEIDGRSTRGIPLWELQSVLAQEPGTELSLEILRRGQARELTLQLQTYRPAGPVLEDHDGLAALRLGRIEEESVEEVREVLRGLTQSGKDKLLIDLRGLAGGSSEAAYSIAGLFTSGELGRLQGAEGAEVRFEGLQAQSWTGDVVVLVNAGTQGPAEILAAVLHQRCGAQLVGQRSFGLAGHQRLVPLSDGSGVLLTDAYYTGPDGEPISSSLVPDEVVREVFRAASEDETEIEDRTLQRGLELLAAEEVATEEVA